MVGAVFNRDWFGLVESYSISPAVDRRKAIWLMDLVSNMNCDLTSCGYPSFRARLYEFVTAIDRRFSAFLTLNL
jgi:hypothetical protein